MSNKADRFKGNILFLDRDDINTDEIIPARYLTEITKAALKPNLLEDLKLEGFDPATSLNDKQVVVTRNNFGCGSSREHAPWALEVNGIFLVIAEGFSRIYRQNMYNCGMMAVELPKDDIDTLFATFGNTGCSVVTDLEALKFTFTDGETTVMIPFKISEFDKTLVEAGGWVDFADTNY